MLLRTWIFLLLCIFSNDVFAANAEYGRLLGQAPVGRASSILDRYDPESRAIIEASHYKEQYANLNGNMLPAAVKEFKMIEDRMRSPTSGDLLVSLRHLAYEVKHPIAMEVLGVLLTQGTAQTAEMAGLRTDITMLSRNASTKGIAMLGSAKASFDASAGYGEACKLYKQAATFYRSDNHFYLDLMRRAEALESKSSGAACSGCCKLSACLVVCAIPLITVGALVANGTIHT